MGAKQICPEAVLKSCLARDESLRAIKFTKDLLRSPPPHPCSLVRTWWSKEATSWESKLPKPGQSPAILGLVGSPPPNQDMKKRRGDKANFIISCHQKVVLFCGTAGQKETTGIPFPPPLMFVPDGEFHQLNFSLPGRD